MLIDKRAVWEDGLIIAPSDVPSAAPGYRLTMTVNGRETTPAPGSYRGRVVMELTEAYGRIGFFDLGGEDDYGYRAALYIDENGVNEKRSALSAVCGGVYDGALAENIRIDADSDDFNGVIIAGPVRYTIRGAVFSFPSRNDGHVGCDFTGYGAALFALGGATVTLEDCVFDMRGVVRTGVYVDEHTNVILKNCRCRTRGGELRADYVYNAEPDKMVAAPWVLGVRGNARGTNLMGFNSSLTVIDSVCEADGWGVLSTDFGTNQKLTVIDSLIRLPLTEKHAGNPFLRRFGPGYGAYSTGDYARCKEYFYGAHIQAGTYAAILNDGEAVFSASDREIAVDTPVRYPPEELCRHIGSGRPTVIDSDGFGVMTHGSARVHVTGGTVLNSDYASFLIRSADVAVRVDGGAKLHPGDGTLMQVMDSDDDLVGTVESDDPDSCVFNAFYEEPAGWPSENGGVSAADGSGKEISFTAADAQLRGGVYNGTGYHGLPAHTLRAELLAGARLEGVITASEYRHIDENRHQRTRFTQDEYYYIGHVENRAFDNGKNDVRVFLREDAQWTVTGRCLLRSLLVTDQACLIAPAGKILRMQVDGREMRPEKNRLYQGRVELWPE